MVTQTQSPAQPTSDDPFEAANQAKERPSSRTYFGQMRTDVWFCALVKGQGKVAFDPGQYSQDQRCTAIDLILTALGNNRTYEVKRELIAESREWARIVKPSLVALSVDLRGLNDRWVQVALVPTGQTYVDKTSGETKDRTTLKFLAVYGSEDECRAAMDTHFAALRSAAEAAHEPQAEYEAATKAPGANGSSSGANGSSSAKPTTNGNGPDGTSPERAMAAKFLPALWTAARVDPANALARFQDSLAKNPILAKHFTMESAEVQAIVLGS